MNFSFLAILQVLQCAVLIFHVFQLSLPYFTFYSMYFSFSMICSFLAIFQVLKCVFLFFHVFSVSPHISRPTVWLSHFQLFSVFSPYSRSYTVHFCAFLIFQLLQCFSPYYRSYSVCVSFSTFFSFLTII